MSRLAVGLLVIALGCGDDDSTDAGSDASPDTTDATDASDASIDDASVDAFVFECDPAPTPIVAGTTETDALADSPARCGQEAYTWRRDPGALVAHTPLTPYPITLAIAALESFGVTIEEPPHRVGTTTITYETQERGRSVQATALVTTPTTMEPGSEADVILLLHGTTGFVDGCGASHAVEYQALSAVLAAFGYVVVMPDYIGLAADVAGFDTGFMHPFLVAEPTAHASLDAVRAALRLEPSARADVCATPRVAVIGVSQGGHAALWVNRLASYYARELDVVGTIAVVPPAALIRQVERGLNERVALTALSIPMFVAHARWYGYEDRLDQIFVSPWDVDAAELVETCSPDTGLLPDELSMLFTDEARAAAAAGSLHEYRDIGCSFSVADISHTDVAPIDPAPSLFLTGELDDVVLTEIERESFPMLCGSAFEGRYLECAGADHAEAILFALPEIRSFIDDRFAGVPFVQECILPAPTRCMGTPEE